ncbi:hypothetical protein HY256_08565 [Candidatus Sumerlaeota bacterium]|nr:hypothetical protein [Candidatus Sumerlaeota bacterium]
MISFAIMEISARFYLTHWASTWAFMRYASEAQLEHRLGKPVFVPHRYLGYSATTPLQRGQSKTNSHGFRGDEFPLEKSPGEFRIACLGDSTTYCSHIPDYREAYPYLLERELQRLGLTNVRVINAGIPGYTSWESLINFEFNVLDLSPDLIIYYGMMNDVRARMVWPPEFYRGDNSGNLGPLSSPGFLPRILDSSTLVRYAMVKWGKVKPHHALDSLYDYAKTSLWPEFYRQTWAGTYPEGIFKSVDINKVFASNPPKYYRRNLENILRLAQSRGISAILPTFAYTTKFSKNDYTNSEPIRRAIAEQNELLRDISRAQNASLFDFAALFPDDSNYYVDTIHVNPKGSQLQAELFAKFIVEHNIVPASQPVSLGVTPTPKGF